MAQNKEKLKELKDKLTECEKEYNSIIQDFYESKEIHEPEEGIKVIADKMTEKFKEMIEIKRDIADNMYTRKEMLVLKGMAKDDFVQEEYMNNKGSKYFPTWTNSLIDTLKSETVLKAHEVAGVVSSLNEKGVFSSNEETTIIVYEKLPRVVLKKLEGKEV